ncbi:hypothetical protein ACH5RR_007648 [Cinchona calisaya]|uniref:YDG domain-containing protein n=1 Tax=Cinchona calisaya TaxID=153742 RepID=A0ABD3ABP5_9GENT
MSTQRSPKKMYGTGKRLAEHRSHDYLRFQPYVKRTKVDSAISKCNGLEISKGAKVDCSVAVPAKPYRISPPNDARSREKLKSNLEVISMSTQRSPTKMYGTGKQLAEHGSHDYQRFQVQSHVKRTKVDSAISKCNGLEISKGAKAARYVAVHAKLSRISPPNDARSKAKLLVSKADALTQNMAEKNVKGVGKEDKSKCHATIGTSQACDKVKATSQHALLANCHALQKGVRSGIIGQDHSKSGAIIGGSSQVNSKSSIKMVKTHGKLIEDDIRCCSLSGRKLEKNAYSKNTAKDRSKPTWFTKAETCTAAQGKFALMYSNNAVSPLKIDVAGSGVSKLCSRANGFRFPQSNNSWIFAFGECPDEVDSRRKVLKAIKLFEEQHTKLLQEQKSGKATQRIDIKAAMVLEKEGKWVNTVREVGEIPGVEIGDQFQYRAELAVVGLHTQYFAGIDYIKVGRECFATCIVDSGRHKNKRITPDVFIYAGEGGNPEISGKKAKDQKLTCGNLALLTSMYANLPVRVVHCCKSLKAPNTLGVNNGSGLRYSYQGLYTVESYSWKRDEEFGKLVFKFKMVRMPDQPKVVPRSPSSLPKLMCYVNATSKKKPSHCTYNSVLGGSSSSNSRREYSHPKKSFGPTRSKGESGIFIKAKSVPYQSCSAVKRTSFLQK